MEKYNTATRERIADWVETIEQPVVALSEAIRLGAMIRPQGFGSVYTYDVVTGARVGSCALGAALEAGWVHKPVQRRVPCPAASCEHTIPELLCGVVHLNDRHRWSREQIADWVEMAERAPEPAPPQAVLETV